MSARQAKTGGGGGEMVVLGWSECQLFTAAEFQDLSDVPSEAKWFANLFNPRPRHAYQGGTCESMAFMGIIGARRLDPFAEVPAKDCPRQEG